MDATLFETELTQQMKNGYFLEGFVVFKSTVGSPNVSIPYVGFKGVWDNLPVLEKSVYDYNMVTEKPMYFDSDLNGMINFTHFENKLNGSKYVLGNYPLNDKKYDRNHIVISPNNDGKADNAKFVGTFLREYTQLVISVKDIGSTTNLWNTYEYDGKENHYYGYDEIGMSTTKSA